MDTAFRNGHFLDGSEESKNNRLCSSRGRDFSLPFRITERIVFEIAQLEPRCNSASIAPFLLVSLKFQLTFKAKRSARAFAC